jgi:hypothetical protein
MKKTLTLLVVISIILSAIVGCGVPIGSTTTISTDGTTPKVTETETISIPGTLTAENFSFNIVSAGLLPSVTLDSGVDIDVYPEEGKQFLVLCVDATNTSEDIRNLGPFSAYVDGAAVLPHNVLGKYGDRILMSGAAHPGNTMSVYIMYQVPMDWEFFEISYIDTLTGSLSKSVKIGCPDVK